MKTQSRISCVATLFVALLSTSSSSVAQNTRPLVFMIEASGSVSRVLEVAGGGEHSIEINVSASLELTPRNVTCASGRFISELADLTGSVHIKGRAVARGGALDMKVLNIDKAQDIRAVGETISSRLTPGLPPSLYMITRYEVLVQWDEIKAYAFEYVSSLNVLRVWIALSVPFAYETRYEHYDFPATHKTGEEDELVFDSQVTRPSRTRSVSRPITTDEEERLEMWWNGLRRCYELKYYRSESEPGLLIGRCWFNQGCNVVKYMAPDSNGEDGPDRFVWIQHRNYDYGVPDCDGFREHVVVIDHTYYPCQDTLSVYRHVAKYPEGCAAPIGDDRHFCRLRATCPRDEFQWVSSFEPLLEHVPLGEATECFFAESTQANRICPTGLPDAAEVRSHFSLRQRERDLDEGRNTVDFRIAGDEFGYGITEPGYKPLADINGDGMIPYVDFARPYATGRLGSSEATGIDFIDFALLADSWMRTDCETSWNCHGADMDVSGTVDAVDFNLLAQRWLSGDDSR